jgi:hypothetical protein
LGINETGLIPNFILLPLAILVNSSPPYIAAGKSLISGLIVVFEKLFSKKETPLTGAPPVRRLKTYSAQSGYVYQYCYEGQRPFKQAGGGGTEYVFSVSADRKSWRPSKVLLPDAAAASWEAAHARELSSTERYAVAKMALFQAFDDRETPMLMKADVLVRDADVEAIIEALGL